MPTYNPFTPTVPTNAGGNPYGASEPFQLNLTPDQSVYGAIPDLRSKIQTGQLDPGEALSQLMGNYTGFLKANNSRGYAITPENTDALKSQLFQPMNLLNKLGRQGQLLGQGDVQYTSPYVYKSVTTGAGSTGKGYSDSGMTNDQWIGKAPIASGAPKLPTMPTIY